MMVAPPPLDRLRADDTTWGTNFVDPHEDTVIIDPQLPADEAEPAASTARLPRSKRVAFLVIALSLAGLLVEGMTRIGLRVLAPARYRQLAWSPEQQWAASRWERHPYLSYIPRPNWREGTWSHNSLGIRGPEIELPKPPGVFRIVCLGGSTTYGAWIKDDAATYPAQLGRVLREDYQHGNIEVINAGVEGYTSHESVINLSLRLLDLEPDMILVYDNINDVSARLVRPDAYHGDNTGSRQPWEVPERAWWEHACTLALLADSIAPRPWKAGLWGFVEAPTSGQAVETEDDYAPIGGKPLAVLAANPPTPFARNLRSLAAIARANSVTCVFATFAYSDAFNNCLSTAHYRTGIAEHNDIVRRIAAESRLALIDFATMMPPDREYFVDGSHVNERGARVQAETFARALEDAGLLPAK